MIHILRAFLGKTCYITKHKYNVIIIIYIWNTETAENIVFQALNQGKKLFPYFNEETNIDKEKLLYEQGRFEWIFRKDRKCHQT